MRKGIGDFVVWTIHGFGAGFGFAIGEKVFEALT